MKKSAAVACGATALMLGLSGCGASFEGSGSKDAASAEQLAMHENDPWDMNIQVDEQKKSDVPLADGVYTGQAPAMAGRRAAGRRLAYSPRSFRMASRAVSGRCSAGLSLPHLGPPTAPSSTASQALHFSAVPSG